MKARIRLKIVGMFARLLGIKVTERRNFYHTQGFGDDTEYITWSAGKSHIVSKNGAWLRAKYMDIKWLEKCVADGTYEERT